MWSRGAFPIRPLQSIDQWKYAFERVRQIQIRMIQ